MMRETFSTLLSTYQVRKSKAEKTAFIAYVQSLCTQWGYPCTIEEGGLLKSRNIVVGDLSTAKTIFTAHYDTQPVLPFPNFITPQNIPVFILFQLFIVFVFSLATGLASFVFGMLGGFAVGYWASMAVLLLLLWQMMFGIANKHTANDNTSGCASLLAMMEDMPETERNKVCFVFFDHEEVGLFGSAAFRKRHGATLDDKLLINIDCVSDGEHLMLISKKDAEGTVYENALHTALATQTNESCMHFVYSSAKKAIYPSDQAHFKNACALAAFHKGKVVGYYLARIHTPADTVFETRNIECIAKAAVTYVTTI